MDQIINYQEVAGYGTSGQPSEEQFKLIKQEGYDIVINLLTIPVLHKLENPEDDLLRDLNMTYIHIPVDWEQPKIEDLDVFFKLLKAFEGLKVFIHCELNLRVSIFIYLWRTLIKKEDQEEALKDVHKLWNPEQSMYDPNQVWVQFSEAAEVYFKTS
eukprot:TRINITY_DN19163_c1_g1_i8.p2 TRINITY_DN19163_c1_g1~~TRINITY_DN19163_c1_g1_i8.p2  ORF type:complete len:157 (+),score=19.50 TRINITY_DN19163_c1_g1_i8:97-567(+)